MISREMDNTVNDFMKVIDKLVNQLKKIGE